MTASVGVNGKQYTKDSRSRDEKRAAVVALLEAEPTITNYAIADRAGVSREFAIKVRREGGYPGSGNTCGVRRAVRRLASRGP